MPQAVRRASKRRESCSVHTEEESSRVRSSSLFIELFRSKAKNIAASPMLSPKAARGLIDITSRATCVKQTE